MADLSELSSPNGGPPGGRTDTNRGRWIFLAGLLWLMFPIMVFNIFHKPLPPAAWERIRDAIVDLLGAGWILWIGVGIGWRFFRNGPASVLEKSALAGALGCGALGLLGLAAAWAGMMTGISVILACALLTPAVSIPLLREIAPRLRKIPRPALSGGGFSAVTAGFAAVSALLALGIALAPPTAWDALVYHLRIPQQILAARSLSLPGDSLFLEIPHLAEMLFTLAAALTGRMETAAVLGWGIGLLTLLGMTGTARRWGLRHALLPAALLLSGDTLAKSMGWGYVDWATALFGFAALCALSHRNDGAKMPFLAGVFGGLALGVKYTAGIVLPVLFLAVLPRAGWRRFFKESALILCGALAAFSPWILRGLAFYGNPLPPFLDGGPEAALKTAFFAGRPLENTWLLAAVMPLLQSTVGSYGVTPFGATIGPLLIALLPGALRRRDAEPAAGDFLRRVFWIAAILYWAACGIGGAFSLALTQPRLYLALFPAVGLLAAYGFERLWGLRWRFIRLGAVAAAMVWLVATVQLLGFAQNWIAAGIPEYLVGARTRQEFLERNLGWHARAMEYILQMPEGSRVLMLWEPRGLYCGENCREDSTIDRWYLAMRTAGSADAVLGEWRREGWTHILVFHSGAEFERASRSEYAASDWAELDALLARLAEVERFGEAYTLYAIPTSTKPG
ncbi:MAG: hypothetical protein JW929_06645 [Anaerolineales bacterium]|nr:hypothetical protein [Anaerolineales bacterium]